MIIGPVPVFTIQRLTGIRNPVTSSPNNYQLHRNTKLNIIKFSQTIPIFSR